MYDSIKLQFLEMRVLEDCGSNPREASLRQRWTFQESWEGIFLRRGACLLWNLREKQKIVRWVEGSIVRGKFAKKQPALKALLHLKSKSGNHVVELSTEAGAKSP